jgi:hypothetical protein
MAGILNKLDEEVDSRPPSLAHLSLPGSNADDV